MGIYAVIRKSSQDKYAIQRIFGQLDQGLANDENRTRAMQFVGALVVFSTCIETILYSQFRARLVDQTYSQGGFSLSKEAELDLHGEQFAWDAEALSLRIEDLNHRSSFGSISLNEDKKDLPQNFLWK